MRLAQPSPPFSRSASNVWPALPCLKPSFNLRPTLDAGKTSAGRTRVFPESSDLIGYGTGFSLSGLYTTAKTFLVVNFKPRGRNDMVVQHGNMFLGHGSSQEVKFTGQSQTLGQETWPLVNSNFKHCCCCCDWGDFWA